MAALAVVIQRGINGQQTYLNAQDYWTADRERAQVLPVHEARRLLACGAIEAAPSCTLVPLAAAIYRDMPLDTERSEALEALALEGNEAAGFELGRTLAFLDDDEDDREFAKRFSGAVAAAYTRGRTQGQAEIETIEKRIARRIERKHTFFVPPQRSVLLVGSLWGPVRIVGGFGPVREAQAHAQTLAIESGQMWAARRILAPLDANRAKGDEHTLAAGYDPNGQWIVADGDIERGFKLYGPFEDEHDADEFGRPADLRTFTMQMQPASRPNEQAAAA